MLAHKGLLTLYTGIAELILQQRMAPTQTATAHLSSLRTELDLACTLLHPADDISHFLVAREEYQIRSKLAARMRSSPCSALHLTIHFLLTNKFTGEQQIPQIWRISVETGEQGKAEGDCQHEKLHCLRKVVDHLSAPHVFTELLRTRQLSKNYILDFQIDLADNRDELSCPLEETRSMWSVQGRLGEEIKLRVDCYWRQHMQLPAVPPSIVLRQPLWLKNKSEQTCGDSCELPLPYDHRRRLRSCESPVFELYDSEFECTVLSSEGDCMVQGQLVGEVLLEVDEFELLVEDTDEEEQFLMRNEGLLEEWGRLVKGLN